MVYLDGQPLTHQDVQTALQEVGLDARHNAELQPSRVWVDDQAEEIERTSA